jgi:Tol biopolymer transport system component
MRGGPWQGFLSARAGTHLYLLDVLSGECAALSADAQRADSLPAFAPDGRQIAFVGNDTQQLQRPLPPRVQQVILLDRR